MGRNADRQVALGIVGVGAGLALVASSCLYVVGSVRSVVRDELLD